VSYQRFVNFYPIISFLFFLRVDTDYRRSYVRTFIILNILKFIPLNAEALPYSKQWRTVGVVWGGSTPPPPEIPKF
jgi:hypothetical protein